MKLIYLLFLLQPLVMKSSDCSPNHLVAIMNSSGFVQLVRLGRHCVQMLSQAIRDFEHRLSKQSPVEFVHFKTLNCH